MTEGRAMRSDTELLRHLYDRFNARDLEALLTTMHPHVVWANGMEGGHVHGRDGVREYWALTMDNHQPACRAYPLLDARWRRY
jgi:ketosteroid isomerase-like protein